MGMGGVEMYMGKVNWMRGKYEVREGGYGVNRERDELGMSLEGVEKEGLLWCKRKEGRG